MFYTLTPDLVLSSLESEGFETTGRILQLNSYENRVFEIELENRPSVIAKFYRPHRWSREAILDEHGFLSEITHAGFKTAPALRLKSGSTVAEAGEESESIFWSVFPKIKGRMPQEILPKDFERIGLALGHLHNIGAQRKAPNRPSVDSKTMGWPSLKLLEKWVAPELWPRYQDAARHVLHYLEEASQGITTLRIHGDCHRGNILDSGEELFFVDFDDFANGPAVQDFWMLVGGDQDEEEENLENLLTGYEKLRTFDDMEIDLLLPLRGLRLLHYSAWIAKRWEDPSFPKLFPNYNTYNYWAEETDSLESIARLL